MTAVRRAVVLLLALALSAVLTAVPSFATGDTATGDVTPPRLLSLVLDPPAVDVSDGPAQSVVTVRLADDGTGVQFASLEYHRPSSRAVLLHAAFTRISGDEFDGVWRAVMEIPQHAEHGDWPLLVHAADRVGNDTMIGPDVLRLSGQPAALAVASRTPDTTAPEAVTSAVSPEQLDVTAGPATAVLRVGVRDALAGTADVSLFAFAPDGSSGAGTTTPARLVEGTPQDGVWEGTLQVKQYAPAGRWELAVRLSDAAGNSIDVPSEQLQSVGTAVVTVVSQEDTSPPEVLHASPLPSELDVSDSDQQLEVRLTVSDDLSGVLAVDHDTWAAGLLLQHPLQQAGVSGMQLVTGTAWHGDHAATFVVPRSAATGPWRVVVHVTDEVGNQRTLDPLALEQLGLPQAVLVYNTPLPPRLVEAVPGDGTATVTWEPPSDERGAEVVEYLVDDLTSGQTLTAAAEDRLLVVPGLRNGVQHDFAVRAVNRAGTSDSSGTVSATPSGVPEEPSPTVARLAGSDRTATAVAVSRDAFPDGAAGAVVLTRGDDPADALAGTPLAAAVAGPLLVTGSARLDDRVLAEVHRLLPTGATVHLLGGDRALSPEVASALADAGYRVTRHAGRDRFETATVVAERVTPSPSTVLLADGRSWADALAAGAAAASAGGVVVLTDGARLPAETSAYLSRTGATRMAVGGPAAAALPSARAVVGADRYATAVALARLFPGRNGAVALATGASFADALSGGAHAARVGAALLLTAPRQLPTAVADHVSQAQPTRVVVYGGQAAVSEDVVARVRQLVA